MSGRSARRRILPCVLSLLALFALPPHVGRAEERFRYRGYYLLFTRAPTFRLEAWKETIDCLHEDGGNVVVLWMGGAFRSKKFPITWRYNETHANIQHDFVRELIDHAHAPGEDFRTKPTRLSGQCLGSHDAPIAV